MDNNVSTLSFIYKGNKDLAQRYVDVGTLYSKVLDSGMALGNLNQGRLFKTLDDGTTIECLNKFGVKTVVINSPNFIQVQVRGPERKVVSSKGKRMTWDKLPPLEEGTNYIDLSQMTEDPDVEGGYYCTVSVFNGTDENNRTLPAEFSVKMSTGSVGWSIEQGIRQTDGSYKVDGKSATLLLGADVEGDCEIVAWDGKTTLKERVGIEDFQYWIPVVTNSPTATKWVKLNRELIPIVSTLTTAVPVDIASKAYEQFDINRETVEDSFDPIIYLYESEWHAHCWFSLFHGREIYTVGEKEGYASMSDIKLTITNETSLSASYFLYSGEQPPTPSMVTPAETWGMYDVPWFDSDPDTSGGYYGWYSHGKKVLYNGNEIGHLMLNSSRLYDIGQKVGYVLMSELSGGDGNGPVRLYDTVNPYTQEWVYHESTVTVNRAYLLVNGERDYVFNGYASTVKGWEGETTESAFFYFEEETHGEVRVDLFEGKTFHVSKTFADLVEVDIYGIYLPLLFNVDGVDYYGEYEGIRRSK